MASFPATVSGQTFDCSELLSLLNPDKVGITCVGYAPTQGRRCRNAIAAENIDKARVRFSKLKRADGESDVLLDHLRIAAGRLLCRAYHQDQADDVAEKWLETIHSHIDESKAKQRQVAKEKKSQVANEKKIEVAKEKKIQVANERQNQVAQEPRPQSTHGNGDVVVQQPGPSTPRRPQDIFTPDASVCGDSESSFSEDSLDSDEMEEDKENLVPSTTSSFFANMFAKPGNQGQAIQPDERSSKTLSAESPSPGRKGYRPSPSVSPIPSPRRDWQEEWDRYEQAWKLLAREDADTLPMTLRDLMPWPVAGGDASTVDQDAVEDFFAMAPGAIVDDDQAYARMMKRQAARWSPRRLEDRFGEERMNMAGLKHLVCLVHEAIVSIV